MRRLAAVVLAAAAGLSTLTLTAPDAHAAARNGSCEVGEFCYYFNSDQAGSVSDFTTSLGDYGTQTPSCYVFKGAGNGHGKCVKNNAASVWNRTSKPVTVYLNSHFGGATQVIPPGARANLSAQLKNNNASHRIGTATTSTAPKPSAGQTQPAGTQNMSTALYHAPGKLICGFDGYRNIAGKHEGVDFYRGSGSAVYSLTEGEVINVVPRSATRGLSLLAIYQPSTNKTVIYLHLAPAVSVGQKIAKGQRIGVEASRGTNNTHTHVEVRDGKQKYAAKSINDYVLENANPAPYWASQGYAVR